MKYYAAARFYKATGSVSIVVGSLSQEMIECWALLNTGKSSVTLIIDVNAGECIVEFDGKGKIPTRRSGDDMIYTAPFELIEEIREALT